LSTTRRTAQLGLGCGAEGTAGEDDGDEDGDEEEADTDACTFARKVSLRIGTEKNG